MTRKTLTKRTNTVLVRNHADKTVPLTTPKPSLDELRRQAQEMVRP